MALGGFGGGGVSQVIPALHNEIASGDSLNHEISFDKAENNAIFGTGAAGYRSTGARGFLGKTGAYVPDRQIADFSAAFSGGVTSVRRMTNRILVVGEDNGIVNYLDISDPTAPSAIGSIDLGAGSADHSLAQNGPFTYVASNQRGELSVVDATDPSNPSNPTNIARSFNVASGERIDQKGKWMAIPEESAGDGTLWDLNDPTSPTERGSIGRTAGVAIVDRERLVRGNGGNNVITMDITDPDNPSTVVNDNSHDEINSVGYGDRYVYALDEADDNFIVWNPFVDTVSSAVVSNTNVSNPDGPKGIAHGFLYFQMDWSADVIRIFYTAEPGSTQLISTLTFSIRPNPEGIETLPGGLLAIADDANNRLLIYG